MRRGLGFVLGGLVLSGFLLFPASRAAGQTEMFGLKLGGDVELGGRLFADRPSPSERGKFEEYRDIPQGIFLEDLRLRLDSKDESYSLEFRAKEAGEEDQNFLLRSSKLGRYEFEFEWDQIPHVFSRTGRSPYNETSRGVFELPDSIQTTLQGASAAARPGILQSFLAGARDIDLETRWDIARMALKLTPTPDWDLRAEYTRTRKEGERPIGTTLTAFTNQVELPEPIEQTVHDLRLTAQLAREQWQLQFSYNLSVFQNDVDVLIWDNPLRVTDHATLGSSRGRLDLAPDNIAHTVGITGALNLPLRSRLTGTFSYGLRFQDDNFIPHTINSAITDPGLALPADSLDGQVHTRLFNLRFTSHPLRDISIGARYRLYDFDDQTRNLTFPARVRTDATLLTDPITSSRFSYTKHNAGADVGWRLLTPLSLKVGYEWERWDRDERHREAPLTDEHTPKVSLDYTPFDWLLLRASYARSWRRISDYNPFAHLAHTVGAEEAAVEAPQAQSTLLRKFDEADRDRDRVDFLAQLTFFDTLTFTPTVSFRNDDYKNSFLGLQDDESWAAGIDLSWSPMERVAFFASYMREEFFYRQRSRNRVPPAQLENPTFDWVAKNEDEVDTFGAGIDAALIPKKLDFRLAWSYSRARGEMRAFNPVTPTGGTAAQNLSATAVDFPEIEDSLHQLEASLRYRINKGWSAKLSYIFEKFDISDFRTDDIQPFMGGVDASTATSIFLGAQIRDYTAHILAFTLGYRF
ncbi:MAG: MtrB/PioB family decaheme-associated outer membrane protein [Candidatus Rokubacteria bacterium]|nr:MtrB/PioB family decaheme-associated outer membrane protein [Candidatus Rokubacteria bacterium]